MAALGLSGARTGAALWTARGLRRSAAPESFSRLLHLILRTGGVPVLVGAAGFCLALRPWDSGLEGSRVSVGDAWQVILFQKTDLPHPQDRVFSIAPLPQPRVFSGGEPARLREVQYPSRSWAQLRARGHCRGHARPKHRDGAGPERAKGDPAARDHRAHGPSLPELRSARTRWTDPHLREYCRGDLESARPEDHQGHAAPRATLRDT